MGKFLKDAHVQSKLQGKWVNQTWITEHQDTHSCVHSDKGTGSHQIQSQEPYHKTKLSLPWGEITIYAYHKIMLLKNNMEIYKQTLWY